MISKFLMAGACILALAGCGKGNDAANLAALDAQLVNNSADPALRGALADQIMVDPQLVGQSNANKVRPGERPNGAVPAGSGAVAAGPVSVPGGPMMRAPEATPCTDCGADAINLAGMARESAKGQAACAARLNYSAQWADRLPARFPLYPGAALREAAGSDGNGCSLRVASFVADAKLGDIVNYYYTLARRNGYDAEHRLMGSDHVLGGTRARDGAAYFINLAPAQEGGTAVAIIASHGR